MPLVASLNLSKIVPCTWTRRETGVHLTLVTISNEYNIRPILPPWKSLALSPVNSNVAILFELEVFFSTNVATFDAIFPFDIKSISAPPYLYLQFLKDTFLKMIYFLLPSIPYRLYRHAAQKM